MRDLLMLLAWLINIAAAETIIAWRKQQRDARRCAAQRTPPLRRTTQGIDG